MKTVTLKILYSTIVVFVMAGCSNNNAPYVIENEDDFQIVHNYHASNPELNIILEKTNSYEVDNFESTKDSIIVAIPTFVINDFMFFVNGNNIFKCDKQGIILKKFGSVGSGPGELNNYITHTFTINDTIFVNDEVSRKLLKFNAEGEFLSEIRYGISAGNSLKNLKSFNNCIISVEHNYIDKTKTKFQINLYDTKMNFLKTITESTISEGILCKDYGSKFGGFYIINNPKDKLYVAHRLKDLYRIDEYDKNGTLQKKILKSFISGRFTNEMKEQALSQIKEEQPKLKQYWDHFVKIKESNFSKPIREYNSLFTVNNGYLWVLRNYQKDNFYSFDIFKNGIFLKNYELDLSIQDLKFSDLTILNDNLYIVKVFGEYKRFVLETHKIRYDNDKKFNNR